MNLAIVLIALGLSVFTPWFYISVFAALIGAAKSFRSIDLLKLFLAIFISHALLALVLDELANGLVSQRVSGLFGLPVKALVYVAAGLPPALVFVSTVWVIMAGRMMVSRKRV